MRPPPRTEKELEKLIEGLKSRALLVPLQKLSRTYSVTFGDVLSRSRSRRIMHARDACIHHMSTHMFMSTTEIGKLMGMHHTSIMVALDRYADRDNGTLVSQ